MDRTPSAFASSEQLAGPSGEKSSLSRAWLVVAIVVLGAMLRLAYLGHKSLWLDEAVSVSLARLDWKAFGQTLWLREGNMALYYLLLRPFVAFGQSEWQVRLLSALTGTATVPLMFALGRRLFGDRIGTLSALLFAVNACSVVYSQEARGYSLVVLLVTASTLRFARAVEEPSYGNWALYAVLAALSVYAHFFAVLVVAAQWFSLMALPRPAIPAGRLILAAAMTAILSIPGGIFVVTKNIGQLNWVAKPSLLELYHLLLFLSAEGGKAIGNILLLLFLIALIAAGREAFEVWRRYGRSLQSWRYALVFSCLATPILLALLASLRTPVFFHRFLIVCLPAFVLLAAVGLARLRPLSVMVTLFAGLSIAASVTSYSRTREDWRGATEFVLSQSRSQAEASEPVLFFEPWGRIPFDYYRTQAADNGIHPSLEEISINSLDQLSSQHGEFWLVIYPLPTADPATRDLESYLDSRIPKPAIRNFRGLRVVHYQPSAH